MRYPTKEEIPKLSRHRICELHRFLPSPRNDKEEESNRLLLDRFKYFGGFTPEISKDIGWDNRFIE